MGNCHPEKTMQCRPRRMFIIILNVNIVFFTFGFKTIQGKRVFSLYFALSEFKRSYVYGEPYAHKFCAVDLFLE